MSYILDALRKVERQRAVGAPGITTVHAPRPASRPRMAPLGYAGGALVTVAAALWMLWPSPPPPQPTVTARPAPDRAAKTPASPPPVAAQPDDRGTRTRSVRPAATRAPATSQPSPASAVQSAITAPRDPEPARAPAPSIEARAAAPPKPPTASTPAPPEPPLPPMKLEVLVYSDNPADRIVFINGRKYVEGQTVEGGAVVERIDPDGVRVIYEGRRAMLRQ